MTAEQKATIQKAWEKFNQDRKKSDDIYAKGDTFCAVGRNHYTDGLRSEGRRVFAKGNELQIESNRLYTEAQKALEDTIISEVGVTTPVPIKWDFPNIIIDGETFKG